MTSKLPPICGHCKWLVGHPLPFDGKPACGAFPKGIPQAILDNEADHRQPVDGDQGIRFEPRSENSVEYARLVFDD